MPTLMSDVLDEIARQMPSPSTAACCETVLVALTPAKWQEVLAALRQDAGAEMRERAAGICERRADYFERAPGHRDWNNAVGSYRASAKEIRALPLQPTQSREDGV